MKTPEIQAINLTEIDPNAINASNLREITEDQLDFFCQLIKEEGQRNPIVVRELREGELTPPGILYGILDGHHRFAALKKLGAKIINAIIVETENYTDDLFKAATYNLSHKNLEKWEIGKILVELNKFTGKKIDVVAKRFGIARSTAFKYRKEYLKHLNPTDKPEKTPKILAEYDYETLTERIQELNQEPNTTLECQNHLENIKYIEALLTDYKKKLKSQISEFKKSNAKSSEKINDSEIEEDNIVTEKQTLCPWEDID